jgi:prephenate dehydratase
VAFQGELGAYGEEAARQFFGPGAEPVPCREFRDVGAAVKTKSVDFGTLPIENTLAGGVGPSLDVLVDPELEVVGEVVVPIHHCLLGIPGSAVELVQRVLSHPVALAQCERFFAERPGVQAVASYDTAGAALEVKRLNRLETAALASRAAAQRYGLSILAADLEDRADNQTRFLVVSRRGAPRPPRQAGAATNGRKTAVVLETANEPGALVKTLLAFADRGINLSKLESRPTGEPWTYRFFLEIDSDAATPNAHFALEDARKRCRMLRVLGSYDRAAGALTVADPRVA